jgi:uncharacterized membrane protein (DUF485 family)
MSSGRFTRVDRSRSAGGTDWLAIERSQEFKQLVKTRRRILTPLTIVFLVVSMSYLLLAAFAPGVMSWQPIDGLPFAWIAALTQVLTTWAITWSYLRQADRTLQPLERRAAQVASREVEGSVR